MKRNEKERKFERFEFPRLLVIFKGGRTMPSFLQDISKFYGTGEKNAAGQTLEEFLEGYDPYRYRTPSCTVDSVIFGYEGEQCVSAEGLKVLLVKRSNHPSIGFWALPGGFVEMEENLSDAAGRELYEETGIQGMALEQVGVFGDYDRDPRTRVITTAYMSAVRLSDVKVEAGDDAADAAWCEIRLEEIGEADASCERRQYRLIVSNEEKGIKTEAVVEHRMSGEFIREEKFAVIEQGMIAVDHAAIIVQGLLRLRERFPHVRMPGQYHPKA